MVEFAALTEVAALRELGVERIHGAFELGNKRAVVRVGTRAARHAMQQAREFERVLEHAARSECVLRALWQKCRE